jgi:hypothetical protein
MQLFNVHHGLLEEEKSSALHQAFHAHARAWVFDQECAKFIFGPQRPPS